MRRKSRKSKNEEVENNVSDDAENDSSGSEKQADDDENNEESDESEPEQKKRKSDKRVSFSPKKAAKEIDNGDAENAQYEVESIIDEKMIKNVKHFLIRWKGYDPDSDTWEPEDTVKCPELIKQFYSNRKNNSSPKSKKKKEITKKKSKKTKNDSEPDWDENEEFEVDRIVEVYYKKNGKKEFLVSWKGYPSSQDSWVSEEDMTCGDLVARFMAKVEKAKEVEQKDLRIKRTHTDRFTLSTSDTGRRLSKRNSGKQRVQYHDAE